MNADNARLAAIRGRCSPYAMEQLELLRDNESFPELLAALEAIIGRLYAADINDAFFKIVKRNHGTD